VDIFATPSVELQEILQLYGYLVLPATTEPDPLAAIAVIAKLENINTAIIKQSAILLVFFIVFPPINFIYCFPMSMREAIYRIQKQGY